MRVIIVLPLVHQLVHVGQRAEQMNVEQFAAERAIEAFDISVLCRLAGLNPVQGNVLLLKPLAHFGADKFRAIVGA